MSTAAIVGGSLAAAGISAGTSLSAAGTQADAAKSAAQLQKEEADQALAFQKQEWETQQQNIAPWLSAGKEGLSNLQAILAEPGQGWNETFTAPTLEQAKNEPGYQFQEQQGEEALQKSAAAKGALYSGNTQEALARYGQQSAESDYSNVYNRAFQQYQQRYGEYGNQLNRLAALAGTGQTAASTLGAEGQAAAGNVGSIDLTTGAQQGQDIQNAAAATASGYVGAGNAFAGGINNLSTIALMKALGIGFG